MKKFTFLSIYLGGWFVAIFYTDSSEMNIFSRELIFRVFLFIVPLAFLWLTIMSRTEDWWRKKFNNLNLSENDFINVPNISMFSETTFIIVLLFSTLFGAAFLNSKYIKYYVSKDFVTPEVIQVKYLIKHYDILGGIYEGDSSTNISCATILTHNSEKTYRVCCEGLGLLAKDELKAILKIRVSNRNNNYYYPICPSDKVNY